MLPPQRVEAIIRRAEEAIRDARCVRQAAADLMAAVRALRAEVRAETQALVYWDMLPA